MRAQCSKAVFSQPPSLGTVARPAGSGRHAATRAHSRCLLWKQGTVRQTSKLDGSPGRRENCLRLASLLKQILRVIAHTMNRHRLRSQLSFLTYCHSAAQVYIPRGGQDNTDVTKRGGRYTSDFVWNTKWQDQVISLSLLVPSA